MILFRGLAVASFLPLLAAKPIGAETRYWFDDPKTAVALTTRILANGAPGTYQIVTITIPDALPRRGAGRVEILARPEFTILGPHEWSLPSLEGKNKVIGIIGIPASARAGHVTAADVNFSVAGAPMISVAVEIDVSLVRGLAVRMQSGPLRVRAGGQVAFSYELVNSGNSTESVETSISVPRDWKASQKSGSRASVEPDQSARRQIVVRAPPRVNTGSFFVRLDVLDRGVVRSSIPVAIDIVDGLSRQASSGPEITIAVGSAADASGRASTITTATIRGPLFDSVRVDARFSVGESDVNAHNQVLSRMGSYKMLPSVALTAPIGRVAFGAAGNSLSDLTGLYAYGHGVDLNAHRPGWHLIGLAAMSNSSESAGKSQPLLGIRGDVDVGPVQMMSSFSHLRGGELSGRQLDATSFGASVSPGFSTTVGGEIARRSFAGGNGTGWSAEIARVDSRNSARVRITHAPGGSEAFARAVDEVIAGISQSITKRLSFGGSIWRLSDATAVFSRLRSSGWAIRPEYRVHSSTTVAIEAHATGASALIAPNGSGARGGYGSTERQVGVSVNTSVGQLYANGSVAGGYATRTVAANRSLSEQKSPKISWNGMGSWRGAKTTIEAQGRMEETRNAAGAVTRPSQISLRGSRILSGSPSRGASAEFEVQQIRGFSARPVNIVRAGIAVPVAGTLTVKIFAERNPLFAASSGSSPWTYAFRIEQSTRVPMVRAPGTSGVVYRDLNGNQRRDEGEPGLDGAVVNRGQETAITDANGRYRLAGNTRLPISLDEASLPLGIVRQTVGSPDIGVGTTLSAEIRFSVASRSDIEAVKIDLSGMRAVARDSAGREWVARMSGATVASFDALPPGTYTLELDLSGIAEPLVPRVPLPVLHVTPFEPSYVTVVLDPRPLRMWRASSPTQNPTR